MHMTCSATPSNIPQAAAREAHLSGRNSELQQEASALRHAMAQQQDWAASQIENLQGMLRRAQASDGGGMALRPGGGGGDGGGGGALIDFMDAPNLNGNGEGAWATGTGAGGSSAGAGGSVESLRAQLVLAEQRAAAAGEFRELSDGWKRKAERLTEALAEAHEAAEAQAVLWKEQLQAVRVRARLEQRRASDLEDAIRRLGGTPERAAPNAEHFGTPDAAVARQRSREPASAELSSPAGRSGSGSAAAVPNGQLRDGVGKLMTKVDGRLDGVFDRMDGLAARLKRGTGALRERLVAEDEREQ